MKRSGIRNGMLAMIGVRLLTMNGHEQLGSEQNRERFYESRGLRQWQFSKREEVSAIEAVRLSSRDGHS